MEEEHMASLQHLKTQRLCFPQLHLSIIHVGSWTLEMQWLLIEHCCYVVIVGEAWSAMLEV